MQMRAAITSVVLAACVAGGSLVLARDREGPPAVTAEQLIAEALAGEEGKEVNAQLYTFPPGTVLPWHIHPDAHEIAYILEGDPHLPASKARNPGRSRRARPTISRPTSSIAA